MIGRAEVVALPRDHLKGEVLSIFRFAIAHCISLVNIAAAGSAVIELQGGTARPLVVRLAKAL
jgi:hypothetical protein